MEDQILNCNTMSFSNITSKFQNYSYNDIKVISEYLNNLKNNNQLDEDNLEIQEYLLPEIIVLLKKAILNRFSADILFQKNYWSWGFITLYYSNFYLAQALNRLKGNFFIRLNGMKNIKLDYDDNQYKLLNVNSSDTHKQEFQKLRENYTFLISNSNFKKAIPDDYYIRPFFNESKVRNDINYTLSYYKEFNNKFNENIDFHECNQNYQSNNFSIEEFRLLTINDSRFDLIFNLLNDIKDNNEYFGIKYNLLMQKIKKDMIYKYENKYMKYFETFFKKNNFHILTKNLENKFKGYL